MQMDSENQLTADGQAYARPFVPVGAIFGIDEFAFEAMSSVDEGREAGHL